jgi:general secretion pathway protein E
VRLPFAFAKRHGVFVAREDADSAVVACRPDAGSRALLEARRFLGVPTVFEELSAAEFDRRLQESYESADSQRTMAELGEDLNLADLAEQLAEPTDLLESADDAPIIRLINALFAEAIRENASDIHIEPFEGRLAVRFRVDGVLREVMQPPPAVATLIVSRVKIMAKLDIAEKRVPQDGRVSLRIANRPVDVRVSTMPSGHGERVVLRLLDKRAGRLQLEQIGMDRESTAKLDRIIHKPHGIFLVTGPTGSGKTTTLYAALSRLNDTSRNIMTVEDPIEYFIDGIAQSQVNTKVDMSFARGLRAILRQDPDIVMVGEIRDLETAQIAIQASLTGHLVMSTLHTNTAIGAITRLRDMGIEPFLLASSLIGVLAQRLVRVLCVECRAQRLVSGDEMQRIGLDIPHGTRVYEAAHCRACNQTGFKGRTAIYELVGFDDSLRRLVHDGADEQSLEAYARRHGPSITDSGRRKVMDGITTAAELLRVSQAI